MKLSQTFLIVVTLPAVLVTFAAYLHQLWWGLWILQHLRIQLALALIVLIPLLLLVKCWRVAVAAIVALLLNMAALAPFFVGAPPLAGDPQLTITHINVDKDKVAVIDYLNGRQDDIIFLQELTPVISSQLDRLVGYKVVLTHPLENTHGSGMLVRHGWDGEVLDAEIFHLPAEAERPLLKSRIRIADRTVTLISFHATRPSNERRLRGHKVEIDALVDWIHQQRGDVIVVGDFNATPWSTPIQKLEDAGLMVSMRGYGLQSSWLARLPTILQIPIDLCLHSPTWQTVMRTIGPDLGSDHLPLHVGLATR